MFALNAWLPLLCQPVFLSEVATGTEYSHRDGSNPTSILESIEAASGKIVKPIFDYPGGWHFHFNDPDGYELAVWSES